MRLIDADVLQQRCNDMIQDMWNSKTAPVSWANAYAEFKDDIGSMPTIVPTVHNLTCDGCISENTWSDNCIYCVRRSNLGDYYYPR